MHLKSVCVRYGLTCSTISHPNISCGIWVIWDKQPGIVVPTAAMYFEQALGFLTYSMGHMNSDYQDRFEVVAHRTHTFGRCSDAAGNVSFQIDSCREQIFKQLDYTTTYKSDSNLITDIATGALYLMAAGDVNHEVDPHIDVEISSLVKFTDM